MQTVKLAVVLGLFIELWLFTRREMQRFFICNNTIKTIPPTLGYWGNKVEEMHFSCNDIGSVPMTFGAMWGLKTLCLRGNPRLETLPKALAENRGLLQVDLRDVSPDFAMPKELANHPRCRYICVKIKGKGKKKKK